MSLSDFFISIQIFPILYSVCSTHVLIHPYFILNWKGSSILFLVDWKTCPITITVDRGPKLRHGVRMLRRGLRALLGVSLGQTLALLYRSLRLCSFPTSVKLYLWRWLVWKFLIMTSSFDLTPSLVQNILTFVNLFTPHHSEKSKKLLRFNLTDKLWLKEDLTVPLNWHGEIKTRSRLDLLCKS